jgi:hypothetical protein
MYQSIMNGTWTGLPTNITPAQVNKILKNIHCLSCELSKRNHDPTKEGDGFHALSPGDEISVDYQGKINPPSIRGFTGFYLLKDSYTGHRHAIMVKNKSAASYLDALQRVITFYNSHGHTVRKLRCDAGSTEADTEVVQHLATHHKIVVDPAGVGKQSQNPVEREAQTLIKGVGALLNDQKSLSKAWWCYAVESWIDTANCRPNNNDQIDSSASSLELITGTAPNLEYKFLFPFGCPVTFIKPKDRRESHFETTSEYGIAVGSSKGSNGATLVMIPGHDDKVYARTDVQRINHIPDNMAPDASRKPIITEGKDGTIEVTFQSSSNALDEEDSADATSHGTTGFAMFPEVSSKTTPEFPRPRTPLPPPPPSRSSGTRKTIHSQQGRPTSQVRQCSPRIPGRSRHQSNATYRQEPNPSPSRKKHHLGPMVGGNPTRDEHAQRNEQLWPHHKVTGTSRMPTAPEQDGPQDQGRRNGERDKAQSKTGSSRQLGMGVHPRHLRTHS